MEENVLWFITCTEESYHLYAIDISIATEDFDLSGHYLPPPILDLPKSLFPHNMTFQCVGSKLYMISASNKVVYNLHLNSSSVDLDLSMVKQSPTLSNPHPKIVPIVCQDKLYVISESLNINSSHHPLIEVLDPDDSSSWFPVHLHVSVVEQLSSISQSAQCDDDDDDDPYRIIAYATRGADIVLHLKMFSISDTHPQIESLVFKTRKYSWKFFYVDPCASYVPYPERNLCLDSIWCASETISEVHWMECKNKLACMTTIPSPVLCDKTKVIEFGQGMLLALSYTSDPQNLLDYENEEEECCTAFLRVDFVRICDEYERYDNLKPTKTCRIVRAVNYLDYCSSSSSTRLQQVIYCYARPPLN